MLESLPQLPHSRAYFHLALGAMQKAKELIGKVGPLSKGEFARSFGFQVARNCSIKLLHGCSIEVLQRRPVSFLHSCSFSKLQRSSFSSLRCSTPATSHSSSRSFSSNPFDKFFRRRNQYPEDEMKFEDLPTRPPEKEDAEFQAYLKEHGPNYPIGSIPLEQHYLNRDPTAKWDFPAERRNFGEPVPWNYDAVNTDLLDPMTDTPLWRSLVIVGGFVGIATSLVYGVHWLEENYLKQFIDTEGDPRIHSVPVLDDLFVDEKNLVVEKYLPYAQ